MLKAVLAAGVAGLSAQINSPGADGYIERGRLMYDQRNYAGCIDQLSAADRDALTPEQREQADWLLALSAMHTSPESAISHFRAFAANYPQSLHRHQAQMYIGDCLLRTDAAAALKHYVTVDADCLAPADRADLYYHMGYAAVECNSLPFARKCMLEAVKDPARAADANFYLGYIAYCDGDYPAAKAYLARTDRRTAPGCYADYYLAQIAYAQKDYGEALRTARAVLAQPSQLAEYRAEAMRIAGECEYRAGHTARAVRYLEDYATATTDPAPTAMYILGVEYSREGRWEQAVKALQFATGGDDALSQSALLYLGEAHMHMDDKRPALPAFERAAAMMHDPAVQEAALYNYAVARFAGARMPFGSTVEAFEEFLRRFPDGRYAPQVQEYLVNGYLADNNYEAALASIERMKSPSAKVLAAKQQVLYALGTRALSRGETESAIRYLTDARRLARHSAAVDAQAALSLGEAYYRAGRYNESIAALNDYLRNAPANDANRALARYDLGYARFAAKDYADAAFNFKRFLEQPGTMNAAIQADALNRLADTHYYRGQWAEAAAVYDQAFDRNPAAGDYPLFQKAVMEGYSRNHKAKIDALSDMMERFPTSSLIPDALLETTESQLQLGRRDDAITTYRRLIGRYPATEQARRGRLQLALTLLNAGCRDEAVSEYRTLISQYPTSEEAAMAVDELKRISADDGTLDELSRFLNTVDNAPRLDVAEADRLAFDAAEKQWLEQGRADRLEAYLAANPDGTFRAQALTYLLDAASAAGRHNDALHYADELISAFPDNTSTEGALAYKASHLYDEGDAVGALSLWNDLAARASSPRMQNAARAGIMRVARDRGDAPAMLSAADAILGSSTAGSEMRTEAVFTRGLAQRLDGHEQQARATWAEIADQTDDPYGVKALYYTAESLFDGGDTEGARTAVERLVDSATPHTYWLARGFILLSDIYAAQGKTYDAREYLRSLRQNYPGSETDIFDMIDTRLKKLK